MAPRQLRYFVGGGGELASMSRAGGGGGPPVDFAAFVRHEGAIHSVIAKRAWMKVD